jgi:hypothetical protein
MRRAGPPVDFRNYLYEYGERFKTDLAAMRTERAGPAASQ